MLTDKRAVAAKLTAYLEHEIAPEELVDWAEQAMMDGEFAEADCPVVRDVVSRLGLADVRAFGLLWEDCEEMLRQLGFGVRLHLVPA
ncbi:MAG: hypothetical protein FJ291_02520 [Planctomycetes bacterium]|nr:hypothetical protein [Planctomycetota bacterium]